MDKTLEAGLRAFIADEHALDQALVSSGYQGSAYFYESGSTRLILKKAGGGLLGVFHRRALAREARIYQRLADLEGVPHSPGFLDGTWLVLDFVDGVSLKEKRRALADEQTFYTRLREVIAACHEAGVAHGDLKRKDNVLVDAAEQPYVIDFGAAVMKDGGLFDRLLFNFVARMDYNAWVKVKYNRNFDAITDEDRQWYRPSVLERIFSALQKVFRTVTFRQARKRRRRRKAAREEQ